MNWIDIQTLADRHEKLAARVAALEARQGKDVAGADPAASRVASPDASPASPPAFKVGDRVRCRCYGNGLDAKDTDGMLVKYEPPFVVYRADDGTNRHCVSADLTLLTPAPAAAEEKSDEPEREFRPFEENPPDVTIAALTRGLHEMNTTAFKLRDELDAALRDLEACKRERDALAKCCDENAILATRNAVDRDEWKTRCERQEKTIAEMQRKADLVRDFIADMKEQVRG